MRSLATRNRFEEREVTPIEDQEDRDHGLHSQMVQDRGAEVY
jgi:hypothetical protein